MKSMDRNAEKPTAVVSLNFGDFLSDENLKEVTEILESRFRVKGYMWAADSVGEFTGPIIAGGIEIIVSRPTRDVLLSLTSAALYDALKYIVSTIRDSERYRESEPRFEMCLKREASGEVYLKTTIDTNAPDALQKIPQVQQQASEALSQILDNN
jgi:hypothetical protein